LNNKERPSRRTLSRALKKNEKTQAPVAVGLVGYGWWGKTIARQLSGNPLLEPADVAEVDAA
jgi:predicted homoserine dehydrogenase-like protein